MLSPNALRASGGAEVQFRGIRHGHAFLRDAINETPAGHICAMKQRILRR